MFQLRSVKESDLEDLFELSNLVQFINLPRDKDVINKKIKKAEVCFVKPSKKLEDNTYIFVLEDLTSNKVIGCSMIHAQHGTKKEPHFYLQVGSEHRFSKTINTGFIHGTLKLGYEMNGPSEIGGLVLHPEYRKNNDKLGKQLSFVRFLYISMFPDRFKNFIHSELMPPLDKDGNSPLWEAIGRRFMNMDYQEADILSRKNKEFILSLFPAGNIYQTLLPVSARDAIGQVGPDTKPVKRMLEAIGFEYTGQVDPFDGGPHYRARTGDITLIRDGLHGKVSTAKKLKQATNILLAKSEGDSFCSIKTQADLLPKDVLVLQPADLERLQLKEGDAVHAIPFDI